MSFKEMLPGFSKLAGCTAFLMVAGAPAVFWETDDDADHGSDGALFNSLSIMVVYQATSFGDMLDWYRRHAVGRRVLVKLGAHSSIPPMVVDCRRLD